MRTCVFFICFFLVSSEAKSRISAPSLVTAIAKESVTIQCHYDPRYRNHEKYWCRGAIRDFCRAVVKTTGSNTNNRTAMSDDRYNGVLTVTVHDLQLKDSGKYWCAISITLKDIFAGVFLQVLKADRPAHATTVNTTASKPAGGSRAPSAGAMIPLCQSSKRLR
ncbi:CMRF35-like molecule 8 isoform X2 [Paramormyrops kingsleyae]|uniref:CMRF35-like molecule 8 isoform X2 n=1 Tax=Paramormyrops kingsleyae TaxID=1676925 RepID=UPI000CD633F8|nr:CMRF35-like molecule 8 isoform X2 [Paramormyrops kingsleyae]